MGRNNVYDGFGSPDPPSPPHPHHPTLAPLIPPRSPARIQINNIAICQSRKTGPPSLSWHFRWIMGWKMLNHHHQFRYFVRTHTFNLIDVPGRSVHCAIGRIIATTAITIVMLMMMKYANTKSTSFRSRLTCQLFFRFMYGRRPCRWCCGRIQTMRCAWQMWKPNEYWIYYTFLDIMLLSD